MEVKETVSIPAIEYRFLKSQNEKLLIQNKQLQATINGKEEYVKNINSFKDLYTGENMRKQPKKNIDVVKELEIDDMIEHHLLFLENFYRFINMGANRDGLKTLIRDWLLGDFEDGF